MSQTDKVMDILHDHYKDSFGHIREREKQRDRLFLIVVGLVGFIVFQLQNTGIEAAISEVGVGVAKIDVSKIPSHAILSTSWTYLLALTLRYCQVTVHIEKQYDYLHKLEPRLGCLLGADLAFEREGSCYFGNKGKAFRNWTWFFYVAVFPLIICAALVLSASLEIGSKVPVYHQWYDMLAAAAVFVSLVLYLLRTEDRTGSTSTSSPVSGDADCESPSNSPDAKKVGRGPVGKV